MVHSRLHAGETVFWVKINAMTVQGTCHSTVALLQEPDGHTSEKQTAENLDAVTLSADSHHIRTSILEMSGDLVALEITGATNAASVHLTLRRDEPVLYNGGSGLFPFFGGITGQYALPRLTTTGTITADGTTYHVSGRPWSDCQWGSDQPAVVSPTPSRALIRIVDDSLDRDYDRPAQLLERHSEHRRVHALTAAAGARSAEQPATRTGRPPPTCTRAASR
ncbi:lipocalin-like domain-containing protein [Streptomyces sp. NPDC005498]|uniref:lipocalin-like domain-containing protein n=2 Tax=unclassified Streptomyces TaxID=2593676 RepID=UPI00369DC121